MTRSNKLQIGSSETTREILLTQLDFENYIRFGTPQHKPNPNTIFLEWFIGFFEAEGCFIKQVDKKNRSLGVFEIYQKFGHDVQLIYKIRTMLGFGNVTKFVKENNEKTWRYSVYNFKDLTRLIWLFNGNLITVKKQKQFQSFLYFFNKKYKKDFLFLKKKPEICFKNAWLSGFFEGNAGFWVNSKNLSKNYNGDLIFYITQKDEKELLNQIFYLFQIPSEIYQITNTFYPLSPFSTEKINRLEILFLESNLLCLQYLTKYPFLGKRQKDFNRWKRVLGYGINNYPITNKSINKYKRLISNTK